MYICIYMCVYIMYQLYGYIHVCMCVLIYIYIYIYIYVCIYYRLVITRFFHKQRLFLFQPLCC